MGTSENDLNDFYHDDPAPQIPKKKLPSKFIATGVLILGSILFFQGTFAGNVSLNSGSGVEFGQGVSQAVACSGETNLTLTPRSSFTNGSPGAHYLNSVTVSNIPDSCFGVDLTISAYNDSSSTPLALFNGTSTSAVIYNNAGTFSRGIGSTGMTVESSTATFTATFTVPVAQSSNVFKLTIQSGMHTPFYLLTERGPGGGTVFYVADTPFACGPTLAEFCKYLEAAPTSGTNAWTDASYVWSGNTTVQIGATAQRRVIGTGYANTMAIIGQSATPDRAGTIARAYRGPNNLTDWYLPSIDELNQICKWQRGRPWTSDATRCSGGAMNTGAGAAGFVQDEYRSSTEYGPSSAEYQQFGDAYSDPGYQGGGGSKASAIRVRPIRAF